VQSARLQRPVWADGLEAQRRILDSTSVSARDRAAVTTLLQRMEHHYYGIIRERDARIAAMADVEASASLRLRVLEQVSAAAELKHQIDLQVLEDSHAALLHEVRALRHELLRAKGSGTAEADTHTTILALGTELAYVENCEIEVRQVLGFLRQSNRIKDKRLEALEAQKRDILELNAQLSGALAAQEKRAGRFGDRAVRLESGEARHKAALASSLRENAKLRAENAALRDQLGREIGQGSAAREELLTAHGQLRMLSAQRQSIGGAHVGPG